MATLAIITARGGSKRIPRKNIREFCGKPILAYPIAAAHEARCFDEIMVSTDDSEIAEIARSYGAHVPFFRSAANSDDRATTADVISEVLAEYQKVGVSYEYACCIYAIAAFTTGDVIAAAREVLLSEPGTPGLLPIVRFSYPIQRALRLTGNTISLLQPDHVATRSQDLEPAYHDVGQFYWIRVAAFERNRNLMAPGTAGYVVPEWQVQDIDNEDDWVLAELKYRIMQERGMLPRTLTGV